MMLALFFQPLTEFAVYVVLFVLLAVFIAAMYARDW